MFKVFFIQYPFIATTVDSIPFDTSMAALCRTSMSALLSCATPRCCGNDALLSTTVLSNRQGGGTNGACLPVSLPGVSFRQREGTGGACFSHPGGACIMTGTDDTVLEATCWVKSRQIGHSISLPSSTTLGDAISGDTFVSDTSQPR